MIDNVSAESKNALDFHLILRQNVYKQVHPGVTIKKFSIAYS